MVAFLHKSASAGMCNITNIIIYLYNLLINRAFYGIIKRKLQYYAFDLYTIQEEYPLCQSASLL